MATDSLPFQRLCPGKLLAYLVLLSHESAKDVMFLPDFVCVFVSLCVSKITKKVMDGSF